MGYFCESDEEAQKYLTAFNLAAVCVEKHGFTFNKEAFVRDCELIKSEAASKELLSKLNDEEKQHLYNLGDMSEVMELLENFGKGYDEKYVKYINKQYYESEEGSISERIYGIMREDIKRGETLTVNLFDKYFLDTMGNLRIDSAHVRVFFNAIRNVAKNNKYNWHKYFIKDYENNLKLIYNKVRAHEMFNEPYSKSIVLTGGKTRKTEFEGFKSYIRKGKIIPIFNKEYGLCWTGCNQVLQDYMMSYSIVPGYKAYYYENKGVNITSTLACIANKPYNEAEDIVAKQKVGLIYKDLTPAVEDTMIPLLLSGDFSHMDGTLGKVVEKWFYKGGGTIGAIDFYNQYIAKTVKTVTGKIIFTLMEELKAHGVNSEDCYVYWLKDDKFAILVRENIPLMSICPITSKVLKIVPQPNYNNVLNTNFCAL